MATIKTTTLELFNACANRGPQQQFPSAVGMLRGSSIDHKYSFTALAAVKVLEEQFKTANEARNKLVQEHSEKDEKGDVIPDPKVKGANKMKDQKAFEKAHKEFLDAPIEFAITPIPRDAYKGTSLTINDLDALFFVTEPEKDPT